MTSGRYGLIEAGGTKFVLGVWQDGAIVARQRIPTGFPREVIGQSIAWFAHQGGDYDGIGIASFGPLDLDRASPTWGHIAATPKPHWSGTDLVTPFASTFDCPVAIDTDVNGAALAEHRWGAGQDVRSLLYLTVGTGIGGGAVIDGRVLHGLSHPEMGHMRLARHPDDSDFAGICPYHGACLEGLASGPAIAARWGASLSELPDGHAARDIIVWYLAQAVTAFQAILSPQRVVMGGGVMATPGLHAMVDAEVRVLGAGYFPLPDGPLVVPPVLGDDAGLMGALALVAG
jgi:fructokinase